MNPAVGGRRWVVALAGIAVLFAALTVGATLRYVIPQLDPAHDTFDGTEDQAAMDAYFSWVFSGQPYIALVPWLATAALIAGVCALALAARRAQLAAGASATASREASRS